MQDHLESRWHQIKGRVRELWGELTGDDVDWIAGRRERLVGLLEEKYGMTREEAEGEVDRFSKGP